MMDGIDADKLEQLKIVCLTKLENAAIETAREVIGLYLKTPDDNPCLTIDQYREALKKLPLRPQESLYWDYDHDYDKNRIKYESYFCEHCDHIATGPAGSRITCMHCGTEMV